MGSFMTSNKSVKTRDSNNTPQMDHNFTPLVLAAQQLFGRNYISAEEMTELATNHYRTKKGKGITFEYLIEKGLVQNKKQAQDALKYHLRNAVAEKEGGGSSAILRTGVASLADGGNLFIDEANRMHFEDQDQFLALMEMGHYDFNKLGIKQRIHAKTSQLQLVREKEKELGGVLDVSEIHYTTMMSVLPFLFFVPDGAKYFFRAYYLDGSEVPTEGRLLGAVWERKNGINLIRDLDTNEKSTSNN
jgi:hypothetical protein